MLLSDEETAKWLSEKFVLSWEQIRPTAKVHIDFGNGYTLERTLVGNTCFIVALPDGTIVDALPGVYTPTDFIRQAKWSLDVAHKAMGAEDPGQVVRDAHEKIADWTLAQGARTMMSKMILEAPLLMSLGLTTGRMPSAFGQVESVLPSRMSEFDDEDVQTFVRAVGDRIEDLSKRPATAGMLERGPYLRVAGSANSGKKATPEQIVEADSRANVRYLRPAIHMLLSTAVQSLNKDDLGRTLFKDLLHIDIDDPYLGLREIRVPGTGGQE